ncbi:MAG: hypothetical protein QM788_03635 [Roseateles sp.]|uniref:hypothetical protein n=1 Tax=Roseateles sp. TaxID=1971397 RepID=UPI0039ECC25A
MTTTYYVKASADGAFAACSYYADPACTQPVADSRLAVPLAAPACDIAEAAGSELVLLGASYQTLGQAPVMTDANFAAASAGVVSVPMPGGQAVSKGVVLIFSPRGTVSTLYASADPVVSNDDQ